MDEKAKAVSLYFLCHREEVILSIYFPNDRMRKQQLSKPDKSSAQRPLMPKQPKIEQNVRNVKVVGKLQSLVGLRARPLEVLQMRTGNGGNSLQEGLPSSVLAKRRAMTRTKRKKVRM